jgi:hypothetical protein
MFIQDGTSKNKFGRFNFFTYLCIEFKQINVMKKNVQKEVQDIIKNLELSCTIKVFPSYVIWSSLCAHQKLSEDFIREFQDKVEWDYISQYQTLSEDFIREFKNKVVWDYICKYQKLSEDFIREFYDRVEWDFICKYQNLSEDFIRELQDKVDWNYISKHQKLSEGFIREFQNKVCRGLICMCQKLSEDFIREFQDKVDWNIISEYQKLSEDFIRKFKDKVNWRYISQFQKLSEDFIREFGIKIDEDNWLYKDTEFKKNEVIKTKLYECYGDYFIAYKGIRKDRYSKFNFQYQYLPGNTYESHADFTTEENSFGLSAWTKEAATQYCDELVVRVKIKYEDVGKIVHNNGKIRCTKFEVLD